MSVAMLAVIAVTMVTFSQEPAPQEAAAPVPMALPAKMNVFNKDGKKYILNATVVSRDEKGITIRKEGKTTTEVIPWANLSDLTIARLNGIPEKVEKETPLQQIARKDAERKAINAAGHAKAKEVSHYQKLSPTEIQKKLVEKDADLMIVLKGPRLGQETNYGAFKGQYLSDVFYAEDLIPKLDIHNRDETVSLRPEFEKLGVVAHKQVGNTCTYYSGQHLLQYLAAKKGIRAPSVAQLYDGVGNRIHPVRLMKLFAEITGKKPTVQILEFRYPQINVEMVKHELRQGHPCLVGTFEHQVLAVGFVTKDGKTSYEILDSNQVEQDKGYKFWPSTDVLGSVSAWIE